MMTATLMPTATNSCTAAFAAAALSVQPIVCQDNVSLGWADLVPHREYLVRYARRQLRDATQAEDVVHDVFEAVMSGHARFAGRSALRSWLTAVLKNKVVDLIRTSARCDTTLDVDTEGDGDTDGGHGAHLECPRPRPDEVAEQRERLRHTLGRIATLPRTLQDIVQLRLLGDASSEEVCERLQISANCLFVGLHRARKQLMC
ncbi:sigma-70 family RNA polymerase sigma factor [Rhodoferax sp.]|uniref:sigma-70 family RNA polymerase sigma factor n=1 Tax=Rhodoferax sp. TaxID=50421 RepID=UPI0025DEEC04|nr:sigma-70 family RNA polymerase sigma factor [Rhodoferax sp.]